jgi:hypothetical protein
MMSNTLSLLPKFVVPVPPEVTYETAISTHEAWSTASAVTKNFWKLAEFPESWINSSSPVFTPSKKMWTS